MARHAKRPLSAVVLAAGEGTRMRSSVPKPLHPLCGRAMILHVLDAVGELGLDRVVLVVGHGATDVTKAVQNEAPTGLRIEFVEQVDQLGSGDATAVALTGFPAGYGDLDEADLLVLSGDTPLVRASTLAALVRQHRLDEAAATLLVAEVEEPDGYARVVRDKDGRVARVVRDQEAGEDELGITEVPTHVYCFRHSVLAPVLRRLVPEQTSGEYFLGSAVEVLHDAGYPVSSMAALDPLEAAGVDDKAQLAAAESELRARINDRWMRRGVTMRDPESTYLDSSVVLGNDVVLLPGVVLEGATTIGDGSVIGPNCHLVDCEVGRGARIESSSAEHAVVGDNVAVGPFSVLEAGCRLEAGTHVGPFFGRR